MKIAIKVISPLIFAGLLAVPGVPSLQAHAQVVQWNVSPPGYYNDVGRRAFREGSEAARRDFDAHRELDPYHMPQYRNPPVPGLEREHYRDAFLRGYDEASHHLRGWDDHDRDNAWRDHDHDQNYDHGHDQYPH